MVFQFVHQARPIAFYLLLCGHCQEHYLCELLRIERPEHTAAKNLAFVSRQLLNDDHSLVNSIHHESNDI